MPTRAPEPTAEESHRPRIVRHAYVALGFVFVGLGVAGYILPLMPGTVFILLAAACFARGNRRFERWLLDHPRLGPPLRAWRSAGAISKRSRTTALIVLWLGIVVSAVLVDPAWLKAVLLLVGAGVTAIIWTRPLLNDEHLETPR